MPKDKKFQAQIDKVRAIGRQLFNWLKRSKWLAYLLNLPFCKGSVTETGLILIQIDGLSFNQLNAALQSNKMPYLSQRLKNKTHILKRVNAGIPSSTPAFQAELFYGVPSFVPAFEFIDRQQDKRHVCFYPETINQLAKQLEELGPPLLKNGHTYATLFSGGAKEARYCIETMRLDSMLKEFNPLKLIIISLLYVDTVIQIGFATIVECVLSVFDFFKGIFKGNNLIKEFTFIPTRLLICILLRDLVKFRMKMDAIRGVPVLCANFLGYDEQSHRRGPSSKFAHWTLRGIDNAIKAIHETAKHSECLEYDMIIYSDHGHEHVTNYETLYGVSVKNAVCMVFKKRYAYLFNENRSDSEIGLEWLYMRARAFFLNSTPNSNDKGFSDLTRDGLQITTMGPLGHVYLKASLSGKERSNAAKSLATDAHIPLVLYNDDGRAMAATSDGVLTIEDHAQTILGNDHPFPKQTVQDLLRICRHKNAGDFILSGWRLNDTPLSFNKEKGAHGGPGHSEISAFTLLPANFSPPKEPLRAMDIRNIVLGRLKPQTASKHENIFSKNVPSLTIVNHNIHSCRGIKGRYRPEKTAALLSKLNPDIITLQEVDVKKRRSSYLNQAKFLAQQLDMIYHFYPLVQNGGEQYGLAMLSRYPIIDIRCITLPVSRKTNKSEQRGMMTAIMETPMGLIRVINTQF